MALFDNVDPALAKALEEKEKGARSFREWMSPQPGFLNSMAGKATDAAKFAARGVSYPVKQGANALIQGASYALDPDYERRAKEVNPTEPVLGNIAPFAKSSQQLQDITNQIMMGKNALQINDTISLEKDILSQKDKGVTKSDAFKMLADSKETLDPHAFNMLSLQLEQQYKDNSFIPKVVQDEEIEDLAQRNRNVGSGKGDALGVVAPKKTSSPKEGQLIEGVANNVAMSEFDDIDWFTSDSFASSLTAFGLSMLDGRGLYNSYMSANQMFDQKYAVENRKSYANELLAQGYSKPQIQEWIQTGKSDVLQRYTRGEDQYGSYQEDSSTGKRTYMPKGAEKTTWRDASRNIGGQTIYGQENSLGQFDPYGKDFQGVGGSGGGSGKAPTEAQTKSAAYAARASQALKGFDELYEEATQDMENSYLPDSTIKAFGDVIGQGSEGLAGAMGVRMLESQYPGLAKYRLNAMNMLMPLMRSDSGATIGKAEESKEFLAMIPQPGDKKTGQYQRKMDSFMFRVAEEYGKHPNSGYYKDINNSVLAGDASWVPSSQGLVVVDHVTGNVYRPKEYAKEVLGV